MERRGTKRSGKGDGTGRKTMKRRTLATIGAADDATETQNGNGVQRNGVERKRRRNGTENDGTADIGDHRGRRRCDGDAEGKRSAEKWRGAEKETERDGNRRNGVQRNGVEWKRSQNVTENDGTECRETERSGKEAGTGRKTERSGGERGQKTRRMWKWRQRGSEEGRGGGLSRAVKGHD